MRRFSSGCLIASAIAGLVGGNPGAAAAEARADDDAAAWVPAISVFSGLVSARSLEPTEPTEPTAWAEPDKPLAVGDSVEIIQVILLPESVAVAAGAPDAAARFVIEHRAATGSDGGERWLLTQAAPAEAGTQRADGSAPSDLLPTDAVTDDILVEPPAPRTDLAAAPTGPVVRDETERWVPSFAIFSGVITADLEADVASSTMAPRNIFKPRTTRFLNPPPLPRPPEPRPVDRPDFSIVERSTIAAEPVRPSASGDDLSVEPFIGGQLELMTPGLQAIPGRPRLYVAGDAAWSFGFNRDVAKEQDPGAFEIPTGFNRPEQSAKGQGSRATTEPQNLVIGANAGMAFTIDIGERRLRIKPNAGYLRQDLKYTGSVNRALLINTGNGAIESLGDGYENVEPTWETIKIEGNDEEVYHALGPGLELELDTARAGPFMLSLYATGNAYKIISGDRTIEFEGSGTWENYFADEFGGGSETRTETAAWKFEKAPWSYRGAVGIRFRWLPE